MLVIPVCYPSFVKETFKFILLNFIGIKNNIWYWYDIVDFIIESEQ